MKNTSLRLTKYIAIFLSLILSTNVLAQNHRYDRYDGPHSFTVGFKALLLGGVIWGVGMLIIMMHKKNEKGVVTSDAWTATLGGVLAGVGGLIAIFGLIMFGF